MNPREEQTFRRHVERLCSLGPRPVYEYVVEIVAKIAEANPEFAAFAAQRLERYAELDPRAVRLTGGEQIHSPPLRVVTK